MVVKSREIRGVDLSVDFTLKFNATARSHAKQPPVKGELDRIGGFHPRARGLVVMELSDENDEGLRTITSWNFSDFSDFRDLV